MYVHTCMYDNAACDRRMRALFHHSGAAEMCGKRNRHLRVFSLLLRIEAEKQRNDNETTIHTCMYARIRVQ